MESSKIIPYFDEYFDMVYFINLPHRKDRYKNIETLFKKLHITNYTQITPVDGSSLGISPLHPSAMSCKHSHIRCVENALEKGYERIMIFEDDACISENVKNLQKELQICFDFLRSHSDWQIFYFDNIIGIDKRYNTVCNLHRYPTVEPPLIRQIKGKRFAHSYALHSSIFHTLLQTQNSNSRRNDENLGDIPAIKYCYTGGIFDQLLGDVADNKWDCNFFESF